MLHIYFDSISQNPSSGQLLGLFACPAASPASFLAFNVIPRGVAQNTSISRFHLAGSLIFRAARAALSARISADGGRATPGGARATGGANPGGTPGGAGVVAAVAAVTSTCILTVSAVIDATIVCNAVLGCQL